MRLKFNFTNKRESTKPFPLVAVDLVEAALSWGGQLFVSSNTKLNVKSLAMRYG